MSATLTSRSSICIPGLAQARVGSRVASQRGADAVSQQQVLAGFLVLGTRAGRLADMHGLPDVMGGRAEQRRFAVQAQRRMVPGYPVADLPGDIVHGAQVGCQPRRRFHVPQTCATVSGRGRSGGCTASYRALSPRSAVVTAASY